jgi:hypothetical protein
MILTYVVPAPVKEKAQRLEREIAQLKTELGRRDAVREDSGEILAAIEPKLLEYSTIARFT